MSWRGISEFPDQPKPPYPEVIRKKTMRLAGQRHHAHNAKPSHIAIPRLPKGMESTGRARGSLDALICGRFWIIGFLLVSEIVPGASSAGGRLAALSPVRPIVPQQTVLIFNSPINDRLEKCRMKSPVRRSPDTGRDTSPSSPQSNPLKNAREWQTGARELRKQSIHQEVTTRIPVLI